MNHPIRFRRILAGLACALTVAGGASLAAIGGTPTADAAVAPAATQMSLGAPIVAAAPAAAVAVAPAAAGRAPACPTVYWGSPAKAAAGSTTAPIVGVRTGRQACYDRVVIDLAAGTGTVGYSVRYVPAVHQEGSGRLVPLRGGARLEVVVRAPAYNTTTGTPTLRTATPAELSRVSGYSTLRQVAYAGSFEGQTVIGVGVRARLPFRVFVLAGPAGGHRLVIDVAHRW